MLFLLVLLVLFLDGVNVSVGGVDVTDVGVRVLLVL